LLLEQCCCQPRCDDRIHPTMIRDDDDDLPLHFACCNGAPPSLLRTMTSSLLGDPASATVRNSNNRLAVDDYIEWYIYEMSGVNRDGSNEILEGGNEGLHDGVEKKPDSVDDDSNGDPSDLTSLFRLVNALRHFPSETMTIFGFSSREETDFWAAMWVLIHAAAIAVRNSMLLHNEEQTSVESNNDMPNSSLLPIHAAVIATKYSNFPALSLALCIWWRMKNVRSEYRGDTLLEEDSYGYLPLHWACGDVSRLVVAGLLSGEASLSQSRSCRTPCTNSGNNPSTKQCGALARFNTIDIPCSIIEFLLECDPAAASIPTRCGRLPLHQLVADDNLSANVRTPSYEIHGGNDTFCRRQPWDDIKLLLVEYPEALGIPDTNSRLYPFQMAAESSTMHSHGLVYSLIIEDPTILCQLLDSNKKKM
jgi:hypothetical protein